MERHQLEQIRRSIGMLSPGVPAGLTREEALNVLGELRDVETQLRRLRSELRRLADDDS